MDERAFMERIRAAVRQAPPEFGELYNDHVKSIRRHDASGEVHLDLHLDQGAVSRETPAFLGEMAALPAADDWDGLIERWSAEFRRVGGNPVTAADGAAAVAAIVAQVQDVLARKPGTCVITAHPLLAAWGLEGALRAAGVRVHVYRGLADREVLAQATVGVTVASGGIAETGTLLIESNTGQGRTTSLLPPVNIAVVPAGTLCPGVAGWFVRRAARFRAGEDMPSSTAFATGPSRSADIAGDLALGVHGPGEVHAVLLRG